MYPGRRLRGMSRLKAGGGGAAAWTPAQITYTTGLWWDQSDISTGFIDSAGTIPQTASGDATGRRTDKSGRSNHFIQATAGNKPLYFDDAGIRLDELDGLDDGGSTPLGVAGLFGSNMDLFFAIKRIGAGQQVPFSNTVSNLGGAGVLAVMASGNASSCMGNAGSAWSVYVNGVQVGATNSVTRDQMFTATASTWKVVEARNLDLSAWVDLTLGRYAGWMLSADIGGVILAPAQSAGVRSQIRTWLGAKVGLSL